MRQWLTQVLVRATLAILVAGPSVLLLAPADAGAAVLSYDSAGYRYDIGSNGAAAAESGPLPSGESGGGDARLSCSTSTS